MCDGKHFRIEVRIIVVCVSVCASSNSDEMSTEARNVLARNNNRKRNTVLHNCTVFDEQKLLEKYI